MRSKFKGFILEEFKFIKKISNPKFFWGSNNVNNFFDKKSKLDNKNDFFIKSLASYKVWSCFYYYQIFFLKNWYEIKFNFKKSFSFYQSSYFFYDFYFLKKIKKFFVYNGKQYLSFTLNRLKYGYRIGNFILTRKLKSNFVDKSNKRKK